MGKWWLIGAAAIFAVLLVASIVLALTSRETEFAPGTPERAVQDLLRAAVGRTYHDMRGCLRMPCCPQELRDKVRNHRLRGRVEAIAIRRRPGTSAPPCATPKVIADTTFVNVQITRVQRWRTIRQQANGQPTTVQYRVAAGRWRMEVHRISLALRLLRRKTDE